MLGKSVHSFSSPELKACDLSDPLSSVCQSICKPFMPPLKKGAYCFATAGQMASQYVGLSVCRQSLVRSISFDPFT